MRPPYICQVVQDIDGLGSVHADIIITPGLPPRYGESPDPGHPTEYDVGDTYLSGPGGLSPFNPDAVFVRDNGRPVSVTEYLIEHAPSAIGEVQP